MDSYTGYKFSEDSIKCRLCSKPYTKPRSLPCLHAFCADCLRQYIKDGFPPIQGAAGRQNGPSPTRKTDDKSPVNRQVDKSPVNKQDKSPVSKQDGKSPVNKQGDKSPVNKPGGKSPVNKPGEKSPVNKGYQPPNSVKTKPGEKDKSPSPTNRATKGQGAKTVGFKPDTFPPKQTKPVGRGENRNKDLLAQTSLKGLPCPCCRKFATKPVLAAAPEHDWPEMFPENKLLADLVDLHSLKQGTRTCDPCRRNKATSEVKFYCKNCRDALCESCSKTHRALRSCKNHKVLAIEQLSSAISSLKAEEELCPKHDGKVLDHYCTTHCILCCTTCVNESHKSCDKIVNVNEAANKLKEGKDIKAVEEALMKYKAHTDVVLKDRAGQVKKLENKKSKLLDEFLSVKKHIIAQLEKMETDLKVILDSTHRNETKKIRQEAEKCHEIKTAVVNSKEMLTLAKHHGSDSQLVSTLENVRGECGFYEENLGIVCSKIRTVDYDIVLDRSVQQIIKRMNQFGRIDVNTTAAKLPPTPRLAGSLGLQSSTKKTGALKPTYTLTGKKASEIGEFCARFEDDMEDCWFTGARFLPDGRIILADRTNRKLKLFKGNFDPVYEMYLPSKPWDVTVVSDNEVAVSLPVNDQKSTIMFVSVQETSLSQLRTITTDEPCFGIFYVSGKLLTVTYDGDPPNLRILSPTGKELTYVCVDDDGFNLFCKPVYVTCTKDASQIYVSDERLGCLVNLTETGTLNFTYSAMDLGHAAGIAIDNDGNIYVCGNQSNTVHVVSPSGDRIKVLITNEDITYPRAIAFEPREKKLLVTQGDQDVVKVYSLA